jgi:hypothetical protein
MEKDAVLYKKNGKRGLQINEEENTEVRNGAL